MRSDFRRIFIKLVWLMVEFALGIAGYVVAGIGFILILVGIGNSALYAAAGVGLMALGVYLFFNIDSSLTKFFSDKGNPD